MKKILAIIITAVMTLAVLTVAVSAEATPALLITAAQIAAESNSTSDGVATVELVSDEGGFARITSAGDDPSITIKPVPTTDVANKFAAFRYRTSSTATLGIEVYPQIAEPHATAASSDVFQNDGQWHTAVIDLSTAGANWQGNISRIDPMNAMGLPAGEVIDIAWIALFASEDDAKAYTGPKEGEPVAPSTTFSENFVVTEGESIGVWVKAGAETLTVKFTTASAFKTVKFHYWASCIATGTGPEAEWDVELYKFAYNTENTLSKKPVASKSVHSTADNTPATQLDFDEQKAGTYILKFTITNPAFEQDFDGTVKKPYLVLPKITNPDPEKFEYSGDAFNFSIISADVEGDAFLANPAETEVPENADTADASVIAIAAVACIALAGVVVAKKVR